MTWVFLGKRHLTAISWSPVQMLILCYFFHLNLSLLYYYTQGAERLGFVPEQIPRNAINCVDCGHCCHGCPYESKQSTQTALFEPLLLDPRYQIEVRGYVYFHSCCCVCDFFCAFLVSFRQVSTVIDRYQFPFLTIYHTLLLFSPCAFAGHSSLHREESSVWRHRQHQCRRSRWTASPEVGTILSFLSPFWMASSIFCKPLVRISPLR